jgi:Uma2 family endonuclease
VSTADELLLLRDECHRYELIDGQLRRYDLAGAEHGFLASEIACLFGKFVASRKIGCALGPGTGFQIGYDPDTVLAPDAAIVRQVRINQIGIPEGFFPEAPALIVEVVSPSDTVEEVDDKIRRWLAAGVELAWVVNPRGRTVTVYRSPEDIRVLTAKDTLDGGDVLPGFTVRVGDLFAALGE